jgi:hypothetical protein
VVLVGDRGMISQEAIGELRAHKRLSLLEATQKELEKVRVSVTAGRLSGKAKIGVRIGRVVNKY